MHQLKSVIKSHFAKEISDKRVESFFTLYMKNLKSRRKILTKAFAQHNREEIIYGFRSLKGILLQGGLFEISKRVKELQKSAKSGVSIQEIEKETHKSLSELDKMIECCS